jgi:hypothetical protein
VTQGAAGVAAAAESMTVVRSTRVPIADKHPTEDSVISFITLDQSAA